MRTRRTRRLAATIGSLAITAGCSGGSGPIAPSPAPAPTPPAPTTYTLSGTLTATNGGQQLREATIAIGALSASTDTTGRYTLALPLEMASPQQATIRGNGLLTRVLFVRPGSRTVNLDAINQANGFDLTFYRQLVRDAHERPDLQPVNLWHAPPLIYLQTMDDAGREVDPALVNSTEAAVRSALREWGGDAFASVSITRGTESRERVSGWNTIKWWNRDMGWCGRQYFGDGGWMELSLRTPGCRCAGQPAVAAAVIRHEVGHLIGFYHSPSASDVMFYQADVGGCDVQVSARERAHAAIALQRANGNVDPDTDPSTAVNLHPLGTIFRR